VAYSLLAEGRNEEEMEQLDIEIGMVTNPEEEALAALRAHQEAAGLTFDAPDAPVTAAGDGTPGWMTRDEEF
jgi:predicted NUDIX family NTP pyrophosphohydrolase